MKAIKTTIMAFATALMLHVDASAQASSAFIHKATPSTITSSQTLIDTAVLNGNANLNFMVTHNVNPDGGMGILVDKKLGLRFKSSKWYLFNQDLTSFVANTYFNVFVPGNDVDTWVHTTSASNLVDNYTVINDGRLNNNPSKKFHVFDQLGNYNEQIFGVFYLTSQSKWCIYNQDFNEDMEEDLEFNIIVPKANNGFAEVIHTADGNNTSNHFTYINHPDANNNPDAIIFVTQVWNPGGTQSGVYNNHNVGVEYANNNYWRIYNEDLANMPLGASFNVMIFKNNSIGVEENKLTSNHVKIVPNPVTSGNPFTLVLDELLSGDVEISIHDLTGKMVKSQRFTKTTPVETITLFTDYLSKGLYVLKVVNNGKAGAQKLILQ